MDPDEHFKDLSMNYTLGKILSKGTEFTYEYDFGSTTFLNLKVVSEREVEDADSLIGLLARNDPPLVKCALCGEITTNICPQCGYTRKGWLCDECAPEHECGEDILLPVVNSPRLGVCGYTGED